MPNVFLVGLMGAGKTTIGRILARKLGLRFVDSDHEIEARTGATIPWIFEIEGEASFRRREADVIRELTGQQDRAGHRRRRHPQSGKPRLSEGKRHGDLPACQRQQHPAAHRHDKNRPLLQTADPRKKLEELMAVRDPLYTEVADIVIDTGRPNVQSMVPTF
jgi:3-dehydroquinate synthase